MMREDSALQELKGNTERANELRSDAQKLLPAVLSLYKSGDGVWFGLHDDGNRVELRHCVDYIYVGNALAHDLSPGTRREMTGFVKRELLTRDWMRAMSLKDAAAAISDRPDHGPMGAYDGWPHGRTGHRLENACPSRHPLNGGGHGTRNAGRWPHL